MREKLNNRYNILSFSFVLIAIIMIIQLANLQIVRGKEYDERSQRSLLNEREIAAPRGNIVDRYGVPIAVNQVGFTVQITRIKKFKGDELNDMLLRLVDIFEKNNDNYYKSMSNYLLFNPIRFEPSKSQKQVEKWKEDMVLKSKDLELLDSAQAVFEYFRNDKFKISEKYSDEEAYKIMTLKYEMLMRGYYNSSAPLSIAKNVSKETVAEIEESNSDFPGITTDMEPMRKYVDGQLTAHILGYVRGIDYETYIKKKDEGYDMNDIIGKSGIELAAEKYLKGKDGVRKIEVDTGGRTTEELHEISAKPGDTVVLTLDTKLQRVAMESLEKNIESIRKKANYKTNFGDANAGAAVAIDISNGEVLAMASYPSYDPSIFLASPDNKEAQKAITDLINNSETSPQLNRAISGIYAPGSTFKPITAIAGLEEGFIKPDTAIYDNGVEVIGGRKFWCLEYRNGLGKHGDLVLQRALATSCNMYFHKLGVWAGIDNIVKWAGYFGLGERTGIDILGESKGILASKEYKMNNFKESWWVADTAQASIGQLYNAFTPLQLTNYVSTVANGGKRYTPHLIKRVVGYDGTIVSEVKPEFTEIPIKKSTLDAVKQGMVAVTNSVDGTAVETFRELTRNGIEVAGKTGTAETGNEARHSSNALFVAYAPADNPKIAVAVVVERGTWGAYTAPIARDILEEYFDLNNKSSLDDKIKPDEVAFTH